MEAAPNAPPYPQSNRPSYAQALFSGNYSLARTGASYPFSAPTILDTGGGTADIHQASPLIVPDALLDADKKNVLSGTQFSLKAPGTAGSGDLDLSFVTGATATIDQVNVSLAKAQPGDKPKAEVNMGLVPYFRYDIVFDVERGNVGFAPCTAAAPVANVPVPILSTWALGLLAAALALFGAFARRTRRDRG